MPLKRGYAQGLKPREARAARTPSFGPEYRAPLPLLKGKRGRGLRQSLVGVLSFEGEEQIADLFVADEWNGVGGLIELIHLLEISVFGAHEVVHHGGAGKFWIFGFHGLENGPVFLMDQIDGGMGIGDVIDAVKAPDEAKNAEIAEDFDGAGAGGGFHENAMETHVGAGEGAGGGFVEGLWFLGIDFGEECRDALYFAGEEVDHPGCCALCGAGGDAGFNGGAEFGKFLDFVACGGVYCGALMCDMADDAFGVELPYGFAYGPPADAGFT